MSATPLKEDSMEKKEQKPMTFKKAIELAMRTPHITNKDIIRLRKEEKAKQKQLKK